MSPKIITFKVKGYECLRCGHRWIPRTKKTETKLPPKICPKCKSPYWDTSSDDDDGGGREKVRKII
jgi:DNA-directed RNA polymerase subunit RPC12/RpoP